MALMYRADSSTARFAAASDPFRTASALSAFRVFSYDFCHCGKSGNLDEKSAAERVTARISEFIFRSPRFVLPDPPLPPNPPPKSPPDTTSNYTSPPDPTLPSATIPVDRICLR